MQRECYCAFHAQNWSSQVWILSVALYKKCFNAASVSWEPFVTAIFVRYETSSCWSGYLSEIPSVWPRIYPQNIWLPSQLSSGNATLRAHLSLHPFFSEPTCLPLGTVTLKLNCHSCKLRDPLQDKITGFHWNHPCLDRIKALSLAFHHDLMSTSLSSLLWLPHSTSVYASGYHL